MRSAPPKRAKSRTYLEAMNEYSDEHGMKRVSIPVDPPVHLGLLQLGLGVGGHPQPFTITSAPISRARSTTRLRNDVERRRWAGAPPSR